MSRLQFSIILKRVQNEVITAIREGGESVVKEAVRLVPLDLGDLQNSIQGDTSKSTLTGEKDNGMTYTIGSALPYAYIQHENLAFNHPSLKNRRKFNMIPNGRQAKYLEQPINELRDRIIDNINTAVKRGLNK